MRYRFAQFVFDTEQSRLIGPDGEISLRRQTLRALGVLLERAPAVVGRDELLDRAWGHQAISANAVSQAVLELRRALGDSAGDAAIIETRHRLGYRIVPEVLRVDAAAAIGDLPMAATAGDTRPPGRSGLRRLVLAIAVFITALASAVLLWSLPRTPVAADVHAPLRDQAPADDTARADYWSGLLALRDGRLAEAIGLLDRARAREPQSAAIVASIADALLRSGRYAEARAALASLPLQAAALSRSDHLRWDALAATARHDRREARSRYQAIFTYEPGDLDAGYALFDLHLQFADHPAAEHVVAALSAIKGDAASSRLHLARARLAGLSGDQHQREAQSTAAVEAAAAGTAVRLLAGLEACDALLARARLERADACAAERALEAEALGHARAAARAAAIRGVAARESGRFDAADALLATASVAAMEQGDRIGWRDLELERAMLERTRGQLDAALARLQALEQALDHGDDQPGTSRLLGVRGISLAQAGQPEQARAALQESIALAVAMDLRQVEAGSRNNLGMLEARSGHGAEASAHLERALVLFRALGELRGSATALGNLAILAGRDGRPQRARALNIEALDLFRAMGADAEVARLQFNLGLGERRDGSLDDAATRVEEALHSFRALGATGYAAQAAASLAQIELDRARPAAAREILDAMPDTDVEDPLRRAALRSALGRTELLTGQAADARGHFEAAMALRQQAGSPAWVLVSELDLARVALADGDGEQALSSALRLGPAFEALGERDDAAHAELVAVEALLALGRTSDASDRLRRMAASLQTSGNADLALHHRLLELATDRGGPEPLAAFATHAREHGRILLAMRAELLAAGESPAGDVARDRVRAQGLSAEVLTPG